MTRLPSALASAYATPPSGYLAVAPDPSTCTSPGPPPLSTWCGTAAVTSLQDANTAPRSGFAGSPPSSVPALHDAARYDHTNTSTLDQQQWHSQHSPDKMPGCASGSQQTCSAHKCVACKAHALSINHGNTKANAKLSGSARSLLCNSVRMGAGASAAGGRAPAR